MEAASVRVSAGPTTSRRVVLGAIVVAVAVAVAWGLGGATRLQAALAWTTGLGPWTLELFVLLYVAGTMLLLPVVVLTVAAGARFGVAWAFVAVSVGATLGATGAFLVGRYLARSWVARRVAASPTLGIVDAAVARDGWKMVALTRLSPAFPFVLLNYAFGLTRVPLGHYVAASWIGMMPGIALYAYLGSIAGDVAAVVAGGRSRTAGEWTLYALGFAATVAVTVHVTRLARAALDGRPRA